MLAACSNDKADSTQTFEYTDDSGKTLTLNKKPKRIVVLGYTYAGSVQQLSGNVVGVDKMVENSAVLKKAFKGTAKIEAGDIEHIRELNPDLIITFATDEDMRKLRKIAPTVALQYRKQNYLDQHKELGKILNKEKEAEAWIRKWRRDNKAYEKEIKSKIGEDKTFAIIREYQDHIYLIGRSYSNGCEVIYDAFNLKRSDKVKQLTQEKGYKIIEQKDLPDVVSDYNITTKSSNDVTTFHDSKTWKSVSESKDKKVIKVKETIYWFNDAISLAYQRDDLKEKILNAK